VVYARSLPDQHLDDFEGGGLPDVVDVGNVRHPEDQDGGPADRAAVLVERLGEYGDHVLGHGAVNPVGERDELEPFHRGLCPRVKFPSPDKLAGSPRAYRIIRTACIDPGSACSRC
jgi:hypothetical protein